MKIHVQSFWTEVHSLRVCARANTFTSHAFKISHKTKHQSKINLHIIWRQILVEPLSTHFNAHNIKVWYKLNSYTYIRQCQDFCIYNQKATRKMKYTRIKRSAFAYAFNILIDNFYALCLAQKDYYTHTYRTI